MIGDRQRSVQLNQRFVKNKIEDLKKVDIDIFKTGATESKLYKYDFKVIYTSPVITCECINYFTSLIKFTVNINVASFENCTMKQFLIDNKEYKPSPSYDSSKNIIAYVLTIPVIERGSHTVSVYADAKVSYTHKDINTQSYTITPIDETERKELENKIENNIKEKTTTEEKNGTTIEKIISYSKVENRVEDTSKATLIELTNLSDSEKSNILTKITNNTPDIETTKNSDGSITETIYTYSKEEYIKYGIINNKYYRKTTVNTITYSYIQTITITTYAPDTRIETKEFFSKFSVAKVDHVSGISMDLPIDSYRDALLNVTKLWLLSSRYDRVRQPNWAGFFDDRLRKYPMTTEGARQVVADLGEQIAGKISSVVATSIRAIPKPEERGWEVEIDSMDTTSQVSTMNATKEEKSVVISLDDENINNISNL